MMNLLKRSMLKLTMFQDWRQFIQFLPTRRSVLQQNSIWGTIENQTTFPHKTFNAKKQQSSADNSGKTKLKTKKPQTTTRTSAYQGNLALHYIEIK